VVLIKSAPLHSQDLKLFDQHAYFVDIRATFQSLASFSEAEMASPASHMAS
jgi:hypothetical protein